MLTMLLLLLLLMIMMMLMTMMIMKRGGYTHRDALCLMTCLDDVSHKTIGRGVSFLDRRPSAR